MIKRIVFSFLCIGVIGGCSSTQETLGLTKQVPDEFQVVKRAPLDIPPDFSLRPPRPGAPRPQEQTTSYAAAQTVFGAAPSGEVVATSGEAAILSRAGGDNIDPDIRRRVDSETTALFDRNKPVAEKLFGFGGNKNEPSATVVDAKAEAERLKENAQAGEPVTEGETPSIEE